MAQLADGSYLHARHSGSVFASPLAPLSGRQDSRASENELGIDFLSALGARPGLHRMGTWPAATGKGFCEASALDRADLLGSSRLAGWLLRMERFSVYYRNSRDEGFVG